MNQGVADATAASTESEAVAEPIVVGERVRKSYGDVDALAGVDLAVEPGEVFGLIGPNGAGKTTLVRALTGTTDVEGTVRVFDTSPTAVDAGRVGLLPQSFDPPARLTARELVDYYGGLYDDARDTESVLADVGMSADADAWYETLSGGQRRRTCVATAVVNDPDLLFLDEPTTGIDPAGRRALHRLIARLAADGTTVVLTSHAMDEVERLADRVMLLRDGEVVAVGPPAALIAEHGGRPRLEVALRDPAAARPREGVTDGDSVTTGGALADGTAPTGGDAPDVAADVSAAVADAVEGAAVESTTDGLRILGIDPVEIGAVVDALADVGVEFESLTWAEPSLEDVYLRLTGETYTSRVPSDIADASRRADGGAPPDDGPSIDDDARGDGGAR